MNYKIVIVEKEENLGVLGHVEDGELAATASYDTRTFKVYTKNYEAGELEKSLTEFRKAVKLSLERGWKVVFSGMPNNAYLS